MRIMFAGGHGYYPELVGGVESSTDYLVKRAKADGHECAVLASLFGSGLFGFGRRVRLKLGSSRTVRDSVPGYPIYRAWFPWEAVDEAVEHFRPDVAVIQAHKTVPVAMAFERLGVPSVVYLRNVEFDEMRGDLRDLHATRYIANSDFTAERFASAYGIESTVIRPLIDRAKYETPGEGRLVTLVNVYPEKGYERALEIARACPDIDFLFLEGWALNDERLAEVKGDVATLPNVRFERCTSDMKSVYARTRILLAPSKWEEAWGRVASEAHCSGVPVLGSTRGGLGEAIGPGGIALDYDAPLADWVAALRAMWDDPARHAELSEAGRAYSTRPQMDPDVQFATFMEVLDAAVAQHARRAAA